MKTTIVIIAIFLNAIYLIYSIISDCGKLRKNVPPMPCTNLKNEKCTSFLWNLLIYQHYQHCTREKCPAFTCHDNDEKIKPFSIWSIPEIILKQTPSLATFVLLFLNLVD